MKTIAERRDAAARFLTEALEIAHYNQPEKLRSLAAWLDSDASPEARESLQAMLSFVRANFPRVPATAEVRAVDMPLELEGHRWGLFGLAALAIAREQSAITSIP